MKLAFICQNCGHAHKSVKPVPVEMGDELHQGRKIMSYDECERCGWERPPRKEEQDDE